MKEDRTTKLINEFKELFEHGIKAIDEFAKELSDEVRKPKVLKPYDWAMQPAQTKIDSTGKVIDIHSCNGRNLFYGDSNDELKELALQLKYNSIIHNLKYAAGCQDYKFINGGKNYCIFICDKSGMFKLDYFELESKPIGIIFFPEKHSEAIFEGFLTEVGRLKNAGEL